MIFLLLSIITSTLVFVLFKLMAKYHVQMIAAIVVNYIVCVTVGVLAHQRVPSLHHITQHEWFIPAIITGSLFISIFYVTALAVKHNGMAVASIANKLSLAIPVTVAFFIYDDPVTVTKITGIMLALVAVVLTCYQKKEVHERPNYIFPLLVLLGSGLIDTTIKFVESHYLEAEEFNLFLMVVFGTAAITGCLVLVIRYMVTKVGVDRKSIGFGVLLGIPNYGTMYFLIAALHHPLFEDSSTFFPVNNISIVLATTICGWLIFREKLTRLNFLGIFLAVLSIVLIMANFN